MAAMKERISNVIAWAGFACLVSVLLAAVLVLWDESREKPKLIGQVACEDAEVKKYANYLFIENFTPSDCMYGATLFRWEYKDSVYGYVSLGDRGSYLFYADANIDGYRHSIGEELAEIIVPWALPLWLISVIANYILFGSARVLPWKRAVISEETS